MLEFVIAALVAQCLPPLDDASHGEVVKHEEAEPNQELHRVTHEVEDEYFAFSLWTLVCNTRNQVIDQSRQGECGTELETAREDPQASWDWQAWLERLCVDSHRTDLR